MSKVKKAKKPIYKRIWFWLLTVFLVIFFAAVIDSKNDPPRETETLSNSINELEQTNDNTEQETKTTQDTTKVNSIDDLISKFEENGLLFNGLTELSESDYGYIEPKLAKQAKEFKIGENAELNARLFEFENLDDLKTTKAYYDKLDQLASNENYTPHTYAKGLFLFYSSIKTPIDEFNKYVEIMKSSLDGEEITTVEKLEVPEEYNTKDSSTAVTQSNDDKTENTDTNGSNSESNTEQVWKSATGSKYHKINSCGTMKAENATQITLDEAKSEGLEACKNCF